MPAEFTKHFCRNADGSWTCTSHATLNCPKGRIQVTEGSRFYRGTQFMGFDLAHWLDEQLAEAGSSAQASHPGDGFLSV